MKKRIIFTAVLFVTLSGIVFSQDTTQTVTGQLSVKEALCQKWLSSSYTENGRKGSDFYVYMEFQKNGKYVYIEDDEPIKDDSGAETGTWELSDETVIVFDKGTDEEDRMNIVSIGDKGLNVNYTSDKVLLNITFFPGNYK